MSLLLTTPILTFLCKNQLILTDDEKNITPPEKVGSSWKSWLAFQALLWSFKFIFIGLFIVSFVFLSLQKNLPSTESISTTEFKTPLRVYSSEGLLIAEYGDERRKPLDVSSAPKQLVQAILASEDSNFFSHFGIDPKGIIRAAINNYRDGSTQGASTITQQVAKNYFLSSEQTYSRKIREIMLALRLESVLSKEEILNLYFNKMFLGHRSYGFAAAAEVYYGKTLEELSLPESAMLAGLLKAPSKNNPISNPISAKIRRNYVLQRLLDNEWISDEQYNQAIATPLSAKRQKSPTEVNAPYVAEMVRLEVLKRYGEKAYWHGLDVYTTIEQLPQESANTALRNGLLEYDKRHGYRGPLRSFSEIPYENWANELQNIQPSGSIQPAVVLEANKENLKVLARDNQEYTINLENSSWAKKYKTANVVGDSPKSMTDLAKTADVIYIEPSVDDSEVWMLSQLPQAQGAIVSTEAQTGNIIALAGGFDYYFNNYNRVTQAERQPGSTLKPFIYAAALDKGYTPYTKVSGAPIVIEDVSQGTVWKPQNYSQKIYPPTSLRVALAKSMNLVSVRLLRAIGVDYGHEYLSKFGFEKTRIAKSLSLALGAGNLTPLEVNRAFASIANGGYLVEPRIIDRIQSRDGTIIYEQDSPNLCENCEVGISGNSPRIMPKETNYIIDSMLKDVVNIGTGRKALAIERTDLAGKTGTTNDYVDAWFNGYGGGIVATSWIGFDTPQTLGHAESGGRTALPMWIEFMNKALQDRPEVQLSRPANVAAVKPLSSDIENTQTNIQAPESSNNQEPSIESPSTQESNTIESLF